jgi:hypothetical protein
MYYVIDKIVSTLCIGWSDKSTVFSASDVPTWTVHMTHVTALAAVLI